ncbi:MAG: hypothetical protein E7564_01620 [Ruminococcaceae bacterium]|nr:hypothetical protein [Oscillospiraceae bacterium]
MAKIDKVVLKETKYIALWVIIFSLIMEAVFLIINKWDYTVLLGNLLSATVGVLNFFLMGLGVQKAVMQEEKEAKQTMKVSNLMRTFLLFVAAVIGVTVSVFNNWAVIIPLFFPRVAILLRPLFDKRKDENKNAE